MRYRLHFSLVLINLLIATVIQGASQDEIAVLMEVAMEIGVPSTMWDFSGTSDPCQARWLGIGCCSGRSTRCCNSPSDIYYNLPISLGTCDFTANATITVLMLRSDFTSTVLDGTLSSNSSLCRLPSLLSLDVEFNNIKGQIPACFGDMPLQVLRLGSNDINGTIPLGFGSGKLGTSLTELHLDSLTLTGEIPSTFGGFKSITSIDLRNNRLQGRIPEELVDIPKLHVLQLQGNNLSGEVPAFGNEMTKLSLAGNSLSGQLDAQTLNRMTGCTDIDFRHNGFRGSIVDFKLPALVTLNLGFNNFTGPVPSFGGLTSLNYLFLGHNSLSGDISLEKLPSSATLVDFSHNQLTMNSTRTVLPSNKQVNYAFNKFNVISDDDSGQVFFAVNAGGQNVVHERLPYDNDTATIGNVGSPNNLTNSSVGLFYTPGRAWALELSGTAAGTYEIQGAIKNTSGKEELELYKSIRWSSSYLAYHGVGLRPGNYTVTLHFTELVFTEQGYRVFDVLVAGVMVKQGLDVVKEAGGPMLPYKLRTDVRLAEDKTTLSVELIFSSGKERSFPPNVYALDNVGPMISAISVVSQDYEAKAPRKSRSSSLAAVCTVVALAMVVVIGGIYYYRRRRKKRILPPPPYPVAVLEFDSSVEMASPGVYFPYKQLHQATNGFSVKLGEGGFGTVYKGTLSDGVVIAVKQLLLKNDDSDLVEQSMRREIFILSKLRHKNLLSILGHSMSPNRLPILVTEFMPNGSLDSWLFFQRSNATARRPLTWEQRWKIAIGIASGLVYLHDESKYKIIHLDIKPANILLDSDMNPRIADFGLSRLLNEESRDRTHITATRIQGTQGYLSPEYIMHHQLSEKVDVYSFGVVLLELLSGRRLADMSLPTEQIFLVEWAHKEISLKQTLNVVDKRLQGEFNEQQVQDMAAIAVLCTQRKAFQRPKMQSAWLMLQGVLRISEFLAPYSGTPSSSDVTPGSTTVSSSSGGSHMYSRTTQESRSSLGLYMF